MCTPLSGAEEILSKTQSVGGIFAEVFVREQEPSLWPTLFQKIYKPRNTQAMSDSQPSLRKGGCQPCMARSTLLSHPADLSPSSFLTAARATVTGFICGLGVASSRTSCWVSAHSQQGQPGPAVSSSTLVDSSVLKSSEHTQVLDPGRNHFKLWGQSPSICWF